MCEVTALAQTRLAEPHCSNMQKVTKYLEQSSAQWGLQILAVLKQSFFF